MQITLKSLRKLSPCEAGYKWCHKNFKKGKNNLAEVLRALQNDGRNDWANWLIVRHMTHDQKVMYAIFAAEQVIGIYEKKYPEDNRPRKAIEAAKEYLKLKTAYAADAARAAARAAASAAAAAYGAADDAAYAAARAADNAASAAYAAADGAAYAAAYAADNAAYAASAARAEMQKRILEYGISLIEKGVK